MFCVLMGKNIHLYVLDSNENVNSYYHNQKVLYYKIYIYCIKGTHDTVLNNDMSLNRNVVQIEKVLKK